MEGTRVSPERIRPRAIHLCESIEIARPREEVFRFLAEEMPRAYCKLARAHKRFDIKGGGPLREGAIVDCREREGNQEVHHQYFITTFRPNESIVYSSSPSKSFVHLRNRTIEGTSTTCVYHDLEPAGPTATHMTATIVIQLESIAKKWLALVTGTRGLWYGHLREELEGLARILESRS